jgi:hypothetical protein
VPDRSVSPAEIRKELFQIAFCCAPTKRDHFNRQRKFSKLRNDFTLVDQGDLFMDT